MEKRRLDSFSKILIATGQINFIAQRLNEVVSGYRIAIDSLATSDDASLERSRIIMQDSLKNKKLFMQEISNDINQALEKLADFQNDMDACNSIDVKLSSEAFNVLFHGKDIDDYPDDEEEEYDLEESDC